MRRLAAYLSGRLQSPSAIYDAGIQNPYQGISIQNAMDIRFCRHYRGDGTPPSNRFCRTCPFGVRACNPLWQKVRELAAPEGGEPVPIPGTRAVILPNPKNRDFVRLRIHCTWNLSKEDFLHYVSTGHAGMGRKGQRQDPKASPSMTRQEPYAGAIVEMLGGWYIAVIVMARNEMGKGKSDSRRFHSAR